MHLSTKSTWHHHTVPFQSLKSCKISRGSCQHNATSAFTAVGSTYHYLHCKHFDITLTQPALLVIQDTSSTLYLLKERTKWVFDQILNHSFDNQALKQTSRIFFFVCAEDLPQKKLNHCITPSRTLTRNYHESQKSMPMTAEEPNCENESTTSPIWFSFSEHQLVEVKITISFQRPIWSRKGILLNRKGEGQQVLNRYKQS